MGDLNGTSESKNRSGQRLRALRKELGLSQEQLTAQLQLLGMDIERGVVKRIENGQRAVSDKELYVFARFFHVTYDYLIDGIEPDRN